MHKILKVTADNCVVYKDRLQTERSAKIVLEEIKKHHLSVGHNVYYGGDGLVITTKKDVCIAQYLVVQ